MRTFLSSSGNTLALTPLECAVPRFPPINPLECAVTKTGLAKFFRMRSYKKCRGGWVFPPTKKENHEHHRHHRLQLHLGSPCRRVSKPASPLPAPFRQWQALPSTRPGIPIRSLLSSFPSEQRRRRLPVSIH